MRSAIESFCSGFLALHSREAAAVAALDRIEEAVERCHRNFNQEDELFIHEETIRFSGNPLFAEQFEHMRTKIEIFWWDVIEKENRREEVYWEHKEILDRMREGDFFGACQASSRHSEITLQRILEGALAAGRHPDAANGAGSIPVEKSTGLNPEIPGKERM